MANNYITVDQVVNDFILTVDSDDYAGAVPDTTLRNFALRGIRDIGFDVSKVVRSIKILVNANNNTVELPDDYIDWTKVGVVSGDGLIYVLGENKNINYSQAYLYDALGNKADYDNDGIYDRQDSKSATSSGSPSIGNQVQDGFESYVFRNYVYDNDFGGLYGIGGGHMYGEFRVNLDQNRIEIGANEDISEIVLEYVADEARSQNPRVHVYAEEALRAYMYYKIVERKSSVPANEKARARQEYYNEKRLANARMKSFTKDELLRTIRKNFKQSPKF
jgi:hypothetical protein